MSSHNSEVQLSPVLSPPPTEFPYPTTRGESADTSGVDSGSTLPVNQSISRDHIPSHADDQPEATRDESKNVPPRPSIAATKFNTEWPTPTQKGSLFRIHRSATGGGRPPANEDTGWDSDVSLSSSDLSSSEEEGDDEETRQSRQRAQTAPGRQPPGRPPAGKSKSYVDRKGIDPFSRFSIGNDQFKSRGKVSKTDGRLQLSVNETANSGYLAKALGATIQHHLRPLHKPDDKNDAPARPLSPLRAPHPADAPYQRSQVSIDALPPPKLNIVIMVIGSRGDIQPFLKIGKLLKEEHGHRVRIATHPAFKGFVEKDSGLEFFSVGGDPSELMAFMVKNPGLIPSLSTVKAGEIGKRRESMFEMFQGFWRACINSTDDEKDTANLKMMGDKCPFVADAIIANPPSFAHVHCAQRLGVPLHLMFTFPYSPTQQFPHPLANIKNSNVDTNYTNFMSYPLVEMMTWQGLGDLVNRFRVKSLGLEPMSTLWAPGQLFRMKVPYTYLWSPGLVPKPEDWGPEIDVAGFVFLELASSFEPLESLTKFLEAGPPPVYIGFGSIVVDDPDKFTAMIFEAVKKAGVRALVSKGWGGLGDEGNTPDNVYMLENTPHDWLFPRVSAVVHHGGAGTTAIGLKCGRPTMIVPFFGDQPFWGSMVSKAGAGAAQCIPYKRLTAEKLAEGIKECLTHDSKQEVQRIADDIAVEGDGAKNAVDSFHRHLPLHGEHSMRCSLLEDRLAVWQVKKTNIQLSAVAADFLVDANRLRWQDLRLLRFYDWNDFQGPGEPVTGGGGAIIYSAGAAVGGVASIPGRWKRAMKKRDKQKKRKKRLNQVSQTQHVTFKGERSNSALSNRQEKGLTNQPTPSVSRKKSLSETPAPPARTDDMSANPPSIPATIAKSTGRGLRQSGAAIIKAPADISLALALGFHNAPRLYGDTTVRPPPAHHITGIRSGFIAARDELWYGIYDGWVGLVKHPYHDTKERGASGFVHGIGKGAGGFVLKPLAGVAGVWAFLGKGVEAEVRKRMRDVGRTERWLRRARIIQAGKDIEKIAGRGGDRDNNEELKEMRHRVVEEWTIIEHEKAKNTRKGIGKKQNLTKKEQKQEMAEGKILR